MASLVSEACENCGYDTGGEDRYCMNCRKLVDKLTNQVAGKLVEGATLYNNGYIDGFWRGLVIGCGSTIFIFLIYAIYRIIS